MIPQTYNFHKGDSVADFIVVSTVAVGAFGEVYLVRDLSGVNLILKLIHCNAHIELTAISELRQRVGNCPGLVTIHHVGEVEGKLYYTMDAADNLAAGGEYYPDTLENRLLFKGAMDARSILDMVEKLLVGLKSLHEKGLVHRDVKPANVIFKNGEPLLADFGLVSATCQDKCGTLGFMPNEPILADDLDLQKSRDLYALGKLIYCSATNQDVMRFPVLPKHYNVVEISLLRKLYLKACAMRPSLRFQNLIEFEGALLEAKREVSKISLSYSVKLRILFFSVLLIFFIIGWGLWDRFSIKSLSRLAEDEETTVFVNVKEEADVYEVFCCFNALSDGDPLSVANQRKAATLTSEAIGKYRGNTECERIKVRCARYVCNPVRNGGVLVYCYHIPKAACEVVQRN